MGILLPDLSRLHQKTAGAGVFGAAEQIGEMPGDTGGAVRQHQIAAGERILDPGFLHHTERTRQGRVTAWQQGINTGWQTLDSGQIHRFAQQRISRQLRIIGRQRACTPGNRC